MSDTIPFPSTNPSDGPDPMESPGGILLIDKPDGVTSHDIVAMIRRALGGVRCGHAGTLDPFATGLLVIGVGRATRLLRFLSASEKSYVGLVRLGFSTDTDDRTGTALQADSPLAFTPASLEQAIGSFTGTFDQVPPDYSARKHRGIPHYRMARKGMAVSKTPIRITVVWEEHTFQPPCHLRIRVRVSAGTYIRALARDLGSRLGCGGHLEELRRVGSGPYAVEEAIPSSASPEELRAAIRPLETIPLGLPTIVLSGDGARRVRLGASVTLPLVPDGAGPPQGPPGVDWRRLIDSEGRLVGLGEVFVPDQPGPLRIQPRIVF